MLSQQSFAILRAPATSNYMRAKELKAAIIVRPMPGPWGKAIEQLRLSKRLNRETVAKRAGMTPTTYGKIEKGRHTQTRKLQDIADVFGVPIEHVLQISSLQNFDPARNTTDSNLTIPRSPHGDNRPVPPAAASDPEVRELRMQVKVLQQQIAEIAAEHKRRERLSSPRVRKPLRPKSSRKSR